MSNYSYSTSYPAYTEKPSEKKRQADEVMAFIRKGANNLLQLSDLTGIYQNIVSARVNELIDDNQAEYKGFTIYKNRKRKKIVVKQIAINGAQSELNFFAPTYTNSHEKECNR